MFTSFFELFNQLRHVNYHHYRSAFNTEGTANSFIYAKVTIVTISTWKAFQFCDVSVFKIPLSFD